MTGQLSPHIQCHRLSCIMIYIVLLVTHLGFFRGLETCKTVVQPRQSLFKGAVVMFTSGMCAQSTGSTRTTVLGVLGDVLCISDVWGDAYLHNLQSVGVLGDVLYMLVSSVESHWLFSYGVCVCVSGERERERERG